MVGRFEIISTYFRDAGQAVVQNALSEPGRPDQNQAKVSSYHIIGTGTLPT